MFHKIVPRRKKKRFSFGAEDRAESLFFETIPTFLASLLNRRSRMDADRISWLAPDTPISRSVRPVATWIGHATFLLQLGGVNILTDPVFGDLSFLFPRTLPPGISLNLLPPIDLVLISHNHPDHMDAPSLKALLKRNPNMKVLVPQGDKEWFDAHGFIDTVEHTWWDRTTAPGSSHEAGVTCTFVPAAHWSQRGIFDQNRSLWGGWVVSHAGKSIYFAGDTAYAHHFAAIAQAFPSLDAALMPIGPREPHERMRRTHLCPREAVKAFGELGAKQFVPMHWGTFAFGVDEFDAPIKDLKSCWSERADELNGRKLFLARAGERLWLD